MEAGDRHGGNNREQDCRFQEAVLQFQLGELPPRHRHAERHQDQHAKKIGEEPLHACDQRIADASAPHSDGLPPAARVNCAAAAMVLMRGMQMRRTTRRPAITLMILITL